MQTDGLEREQNRDARQWQQPVESEVCPINQAHMSNAGFRRVLCIANDSERVLLALDAARILVDRSDGELIILKAKRYCSTFVNASERAIRSRWAAESHMLELSERVISPTSIDQAV